MKICIWLLLILTKPALAESVLKVGSKTFTESYILAEIVAQIAEDVGEVQVERKFGMGNTGITYEALKQGEIDVYPEYTGTIAEAILKQKGLTRIEVINQSLPENLSASPPIGFNNTYALAITRNLQARKGLQTISELKLHPDLRAGFTHEFTNREDGLKQLENHYQVKFNNARAMEHALAYEAIKNGELDIIEVYSTDAKLNKFDLVTLNDDKGFFPEYRAVLLTNKKMQEKFPRTWKALEEKFFNRIDDSTMTSLNAMVELDKMTFAAAAAKFLRKHNSSMNNIPTRQLRVLTLEHIKLVLMALFFSILVGIPLGILAFKNKFLAQIILAGTGLLQTIPSLALLCFLIPLVGIGEVPAYIALFLYGLLPIVRNTYTGLKNIDRPLMESGELIGMSSLQKLWMVQMPIASVNILTGIKTSAVINVGTATLAAFIGAGGLGKLIVTGLALNDTHIILMGAVPAALLSIFIHLAFEIVDYLVVPKGLKDYKS